MTNQRYGASGGGAYRRRRARLFYLVRTFGNAGLELPIRTFPLSLIVPGLPHAGGNVGLVLPMRTFPVSLVLAGPPRAGGNAGLELPIRTRPLSEMTVGLFFGLTEISFTLAIEGSHVSSGAIAQTLHVGRELQAFVKDKRLIEQREAFTLSLILKSDRMLVEAFLLNRGSSIHNSRCKYSELSVLVVKPVSFDKQT